ncbi:MAG: exo-alpha-sialidase [Proteobacteria bacterium]|nr:exo-alpha-sialidase [Pseudomonadota bacterium]
MQSTIAAICLAATATFVHAQAMRTPSIRSEFIFERAPFASAHASTIVETGTGLVAAWFGGSRESAPDVGIWVSRRTGASWSAPVEVADGVQPDGRRYPCWNPVLFQPRGAPLMLFYKVGPSPREWWGLVRTSTDDGRSWSAPRRLPDGILGPIKNKPVQLANGEIVSPSSTESLDLSVNAWRVHFELSGDTGRTWRRVAPAAAEHQIDAIQPSVLVHPDGALEAVGRTRSGRTFETWSRDGGHSWTALRLGSLPNPNAGTDAVTLRDGRFLIVYDASTTERAPLVVALSRDGRSWQRVATLEEAPGEFSYPAVIQGRDGRVHITYTWKRERIKHAEFDESALPALR